jgi:hypothetical protein
MKVLEVIPMKIFRRARLMLLALLVSLIPASSFAGVFISVGFAPPILPVYVQPPCPEPGLMWSPGYWAYGDDGYFWVPGTWVPVPYEGALWTPPYWGWQGGLYMFHPGYWGPHVGYYGGVNYGFGYMGIGFVGGMWRGHDFVYNTAVMHVDERFVHTTYVDRTIVQQNTIVNDRRVAFRGGPGGINHPPAPEERVAERDQHVGATTFQQSHVSAAMSDRSSFAKNNGGRPSNVAEQRPLGNSTAGQGRGNYNPSNAGNAQSKTYNASHSNTGNAPERAAPQSRPAPEFRQVPQQQPQVRSMTQGQPRPAPQAQQRPAPQGQTHAAPPQHQNGGQPHGESKEHEH